MDSIIGSYIAVNKITEVETSKSGLEYTAKNTARDMVVQKGTVLKVGDEIKGIEEGKVLFFHKARCFEMTSKGVTYTMVPFGSAIALETPA